MTTPQDIYGAAPKTVLNKPFMHVRHREDSGINAGGSISSTWNERKLNTTLINEIPGSSLVNNKVTLPAGRYYIEADATQYLVTKTALEVRDSSDNTLLDYSNWTASSPSYGLGVSPLAGEMTLASATTIGLFQYTTTTRASDGLGSQIGVAGRDEVYVNLKIWQLDASIETPLLVSNKLYPLPGDSMVVGNMYGLEYAKTGDNEVTVQAGICMDSTNTGSPMSLSTQQVVSIPTTINTIYNLFLCDDGVVRYDTDVAGAGLGAYRVRWIGFVLNNASGAVVAFALSGDIVTFEEPLLTAGSLPANITHNMDASSFVPVSRVSGINAGCGSGNTAAGIYFFYVKDTSSTSLAVSTVYKTPPADRVWGSCVFLPATKVWTRFATSATHSQYIMQVMLKR